MTQDLSQIIARWCMRCDAYSHRRVFCRPCAHHLTSTPAEVLLCEDNSAHPSRTLLQIYHLMNSTAPSTELSLILGIARNDSEYFDSIFVSSRND